MKEEQIIQIERFINGEMNPSEKQAFANQMDSDAALRETVELWQDMDQALRPAPEDALRQQLAPITQHYTEQNKPKSKRSWWWAGGLILVVVGFLLWPRPEQPNVDSVPMEEEARPESPAIAEEPAGIDDSSNSETETPDPENTQPPSTPTLEEPRANLRQEPAEEPGPIAAAYSPNPQFEALLGQQLRSNEYTLQLQPVQVDETNQQLQFTGELETETPPDSWPPFRLLLFTNDPAAFANYQALQSHQLRWTPIVSSTVYAFSWASPPNLSPGLYYYLIEDEESGLLYATGKVIVE